MMNQRRATSALLVSAALAIITACGDQPDDGSTNRQPAPAADPVAAWQVYYEQTHPDLDHAGKPAKSDPVAAWQVYYDQTHPDLDHAGKPAKSDPVAAWQVYYDQTHPDLD